MRIEVGLPEPARPRLVAIDVADRQRRRKTWAQNIDRYALPEAGVVRVEVSGPASLSTFLGTERAPTKLAARRAG